MSSIFRPGRRRPVLAVAAIAAALAFTTTACDDGGKKNDAQSQSSQKPTKPDDLGIPKDLQKKKDLPDSLKDLDKWRGGAWKHWSKDQWVRKAGDFVNPYIKGHWKPHRMKKATDNEKQVPKNVQSTSTDTGTDPTPSPVKAKAVPMPYTKNAAPAGKVFMDTPKGAMVCSGTVIKDPRHPGKSNLVATAGHCVHAGKEGGWYRNIMFVPAYNNKGLSPAQTNTAPVQDVAPYGRWWAQWAQTTDYWIGKGAESGGSGSQHDFAVLNVKPEQQGSGKSLEETVGNAVKVNFHAPSINSFRSLRNYGYPAAPPFNGARMYSCLGKPGRLTIDPSAPAEYRMGCTMTGGSSGGGWFMKGKSGKPELVSVNSIGPHPATWLAGPHLGGTEKGVLNAISKKYANQG